MIDGKARILKIDIDKNQELAQKYQVRSVPTLMVFKKGQVEWRQSGVTQADVLAQVLNQYV